MSSREEILGRVRRALRDAPAAPAVDRSYRRPLVPDADPDVDLFAERVEDYRATVVRCTETEVSETLAGIVSGRSILVPDGFPWPIPGGLRDDALTHHDLDEVDGVLTTATLGIAETGTIVLDHGPGQGRRALSLIPDLHVCVIRTEQVVAGVVDAVAALDPARPQTWISGPSATSDIELDRVEGVHGPRELIVVLLG